MKIIIDRDLVKENDAGFKARVDIINTLEKQGYLYKSISYNNINDICKIFNISFKKDDIVILQYPLNIFIIKILLLKIKLSGAKSICLIHDICSLRDRKDKKYLKNEINVFNKFDFIISHNYKMSEWLKKNDVNCKIYNLNIFDYLSEKNVMNRSLSERYKISYATGKLGTEKSSFLYNIDCILKEKIDIILYGNIEEKLRKNIKNKSYIQYKGTLHPNIISQQIEGDFGLIWDSTKIDKYVGVWAEYNKYNNPHKLSMYMAANLPVIVWEGSAIADFVKKNNIGICVESLEDINQKLNYITSDEYIIMYNNVIQLSNRVRSGQSIIDIINKIELS